MKRKLISIFLCLFTIFVPVLVYATEENLVPDGQASAIKKGTPAPFDGVILDSTAVSKLLTMRDAAQKQCDLDKQYALDKQKAVRDLELGNLKVDYEMEKRKGILNDSMKDAEIKRLTKVAETGSGDSYKWWLAGGVVTGILVTIGTFYIASKVTQTQMK